MAADNSFEVGRWGRSIRMIASCWTKIPLRDKSLNRMCSLPSLHRHEYPMMLITGWTDVGMTMLCCSSSGSGG